MSGALFDFGALLLPQPRRANGRYFYLPKLESHLEARLWNDVFCFAQDRLGVPRGTIKATVLIETILAAFEMDEILYELREHSAGLNAGRWDYIFSVIKKLGHRPEFVLPDRSAVTMAVPFMRSYCELLVQTCHRRGAFAMGGMAAFIPSRRDPEVNAVALAKVREDKEREAATGLRRDVGRAPRPRPDRARGLRSVLGGAAEPDRPAAATTSRVDAGELLDVAATPGEITEQGLRDNISVGIQYLAAWLQRLGRRRDQQPDGGRGHRRDLALAGLAMASPRPGLAETVRRLIAEEATRLGPGYEEARELFEQVATSRDYVEFLTLPAYDRLDD